MILEFPQAKGEMCLKRCGLTEAMAALPAPRSNCWGPLVTSRRPPFPGVP